VLEAVPHPRVFYTVACCESLAGRTADAVDHLRQAIDLWRAFGRWRSRTPTSTHSGDEPAFEALIGR